jgi:hypothetical protein
LKVFGNRGQRKIFAAKREDVTGEWSKLYNEELNDLYCSTNIIRVIKSTRVRLAWHVAYMGERRAAYRVLVRRPERKRPLSRRVRLSSNLNLLGSGHITCMKHTNCHVYS